MFFAMLLNKEYSFFCNRNLFAGCASPYVRYLMTRSD
ncbi:hypothetical protein T4A_7809 [Trichinella pseudospiralis]|uniref:Uncharacterized protein n=1 Tax=Trichinella pseudospiralis TaxID=6337 RepID=A0A0V1DRL8_TRIPS|nr:hypothetical protein T4A_7809 [Trichinella pseudospiralis]